MYKRHAIFLIFTFVMLSGFAQKPQVRKANDAFDRFEYIKARAMYLQQIEKGNETSLVLKKLGDTYYFVADYKEAAYWYTQLFTKYANEYFDPAYYFRAAQSLKSIDSLQQSDSLMREYIAVRSDKIVAKNYKSISDSLHLIGEKTNYFEIKKVNSNSSYSDITPAYYFDKIVFASSRILEDETPPKLYDWNKQPSLRLFSGDDSEGGMLHTVKLLKNNETELIHESSAAFTKDGETVYFTGNNVKNGKRYKDKDHAVRLKIYKSKKTADGSWSEGVELPFNADTYSVAHPALSPDEKRLYFSSDKPGSYGRSDIWYVELLDDGTYGTPVNIGNAINTEVRETFPFIDNNNVLYFATDGHPGLGGLDIFYTQLDAEGKPTEVFRMPEPINSTADDFSLIKNTHTKTGYFSSNRNSSESTNDDNIYFFKELCQIVVRGVVTDKKTNKILPGSEVVLIDNGIEVGRMVVGSDAKYHFNVSCNTTYTIEVKKEEYNPSAEQFTSPDYSLTINVPIDLDPIPDPCGDDLGCRLNLKPIYFDLDKHAIRADAEVELTKVLNALIDNPELKIHIESHTDSRGKDSYNLALSERRAQSTRDWFIAQGIDANRLTAKGYGETRLLNECSNGVRCEEEQHGKNRRSMFLIIQE